MSSKTIVGVLALTTMLSGGAAFAATPATGQQTATPPPGHAAVVKDFGKLSADGARAYQDLTLARLAIFDGRASDAKKYVDDADKGFNSAKSDESVFNQAEATLRTRTMRKGAAAAPNAGGADASASNQASTSTQPASSASNEADVNKPVAWLPVDGAISIDEDFTVKPEKAKAVQDANKSLAQGDRKGAMDKLKLADVDTSVTLAVVPLQQTLDDVNQAKQLIDAGKFYEGSQKLRAVQDATVLTIADMPGTSAGNKNSADSKMGASQQDTPAAAH